MTDCPNKKALTFSQSHAHTFSALAMQSSYSNASLVPRLSPKPIYSLY